MTNGKSAADMVKDAGNVIKHAYNLKGNLVDKRAATGCTANPHYSNTDKDGCNNGWTQIMNTPVIERADWLMQSLCSAHLEEKHQWGGSLGVEDTLFITNEEWTSFQTGTGYTGLPAHVIDVSGTLSLPIVDDLYPFPSQNHHWPHLPTHVDRRHDAARLHSLHPWQLATNTAYATGVFTLGGFEKIVEFNCGHPDYVCFAPSGYNGNFGVDKTAEATRKNALG